jgi:hypothetical protein
LWIMQQINNVTIHQLNTIVYHVTQLVEVDSEIHTTQNTVQHHTRNVVRLSHQRMNTRAYDIGTKRHLDKQIKHEHDAIAHYTNCLDYAQRQRMELCAKLDVLTTQIKRG